jgi:hypothetical protein
MNTKGDAVSYLKTGKSSIHSLSLAAHDVVLQLLSQDSSAILIVRK